jgi:trans-2,3-dihydro-3-hydroxyanthranilate isomerase
MKRRFLTLDVFTNRRFAGNPLAVVLDSQGLETAAMQTIAREFNHPETVFVLPAADKLHRAQLRIFTPTSELPFAGHPTVGAAVALACVNKDSGTQRFILEEKIGPVSCEVNLHSADSGRAVFSLPRLPTAESGTFNLAATADALSLNVDDIETKSFPPSRWSAGVAFSFVAVKNLDTIARVRINPALIEQAFGFGGPGMVFVFCQETAEPGHHFHARMFAPARGIAEDPATGSAIAAFAGLFVAQTRPTDGEHRLMIEQGYEMGRPSLIELSLTIEKGALTKASIGGDAIIVTEGHIEA